MLFEAGQGALGTTNWVAGCMNNDNEIIVLT
jgi:hypothetical protein